MELNDFFNDGFGWVCRHCDLELSAAGNSGRRSRLFSEGEAESKNPQLSNPGLAKWADVEQRTLMCPRCGITEPVEKS